MKRLCMYCKISLGEGEPLDDPRVSHGICPRCQSELICSGCGGLLFLESGMVVIHSGGGTKTAILVCRKCRRRVRVHEMVRRENKSAGSLFHERRPLQEIGRTSAWA